MADYLDDIDPPDWLDDEDEDDCDHDDYELDILTGRASCNRCDHRWYMSEQEFTRHQELMAAPYPADDSE